MKMVNVLHMNGGMDETSYAMNSLLPRKGISRTLPITLEAIAQLIMSSSSFPCRGAGGTLAIADLGCASGPNTLLVVSEVIKAVHKELGRHNNESSPEFQVFLNDLPGNDFNSIFRSLHGFTEKLKEEIGADWEVSEELLTFISGVPGSFYGRLFPAESVHFVHSSYGIHWSSQVPEGLEENKGNIYMDRSSPPSVLEAYYKQFQMDFSSFLNFRAQELVTAGRMVLTFLGRRREERSDNECCYIWKLMSTALNEMASEGLIDQQKLDSFNLPLFTPSAMEVEAEVEKQGSFAIERLELWDMSWNVYDGELNLPEALQDGGYNVSKALIMKVVFEPMIAHQFDLPEEIIDDLFQRYALLLSDWMAKEKANLVSLTVSLTKR